MIINIKEAAELLQVSRTRISQFIKEGRLPVEGKWGNSYLIDERNLTELKVRKNGNPGRIIPDNIKRKLLRYFAKLNELEKDIVMQRLHQRKSFSKIAKQKNMSRSLVFSIMKRAIRKIKNIEE